ncbi:MAG: ABC transporter permease [Gammaproteobacteria bacterium]|nr:ABC transporter permease [Gammaproteobacteria bacterium]
MIFWSLKTLFSEPLRLIVSSLAVAVSFLLVIFFSAVFKGESEQMVAYLEKMNADVWVMQKGVANMHMASSMVWDWKAQKIAKLRGVKEVSAILFLNGPVKIGDKDWFSYIIGISQEYRRAGPWDMVKGKSIPVHGEAVIPEVITRLTGIQIGDDITINNRDLKVVGLTRSTFSMASSIIFVSHDDLGDIVEGRDQYSYIMVYAEPNTSSSTLIEEIKNNIDKINVLSNEDFIKSDRQLAVQMGAKIISMMTIIGTLLATLIVAFTSYSLIARKKQELAIAKALGFSNREIYLAALCQSIIITSIGLLLTLLLSYTLLIWLPTFVPQINLSVQLYQFIPIAIISLPIAIFASLAAAHTVIKVDPMTVFTG